LITRTAGDQRRPPIGEQTRVTSFTIVLGLGSIMHNIGAHGDRSKDQANRTKKSDEKLFHIDTLTIKTTLDLS
jgi:hypothetical protein